MLTIIKGGINMTILKIIAMINSILILLLMLYFRKKEKRKDYAYDYIIIVFILNILSIIV